MHGFGTTSPSPPRWPSLDGKVEQASGNGVEPQTQAEVTSEDTDVVIPTPDLVSEQHSPEATTLSGTIIYQSLITHLGAHVAPESRYVFDVSENSRADSPSYQVPRICSGLTLRIYPHWMHYRVLFVVMNIGPNYSRYILPCLTFFVQTALNRNRLRLP